MPPKVLVTNASDRAALAVIRSLGRRGIIVIAADSVPFTTGMLSKYCKQKILYPSPERSKSKFISWLTNFVKNENIELIIPINDYTIIPIAECKEKIEESTRVAIPNYETIMKAYDKIKTVEIARREKIPIPNTYCPHSVADIKQMLYELNFPVVIKPRMKVYWIEDKSLTFKVTFKNYAYNAQDLIYKFKKFTHTLSNFKIKENFFFIQEYVKGQAYGVEALIHEGLVKSVFAHKRIREYPISGGASTLRESVIDSHLMQVGIRLLKSLGWEGAAMVEFKLDHLTKQPVVLEVNGRFWGSLALSISAGVDFPYILYKIYVNNEDLSNTSYLVGLRQRWLLPGDILWLLSTWFTSKNGRLSALKEFIKSFSIKDDVVSLEDIKPVIGALVDILRNISDVIQGQRTIEGESRLFSL